jgi:outer membrane protein
MKKIIIVMLLVCCFTANAAYAEQPLSLEECKSLALRNNINIINSKLEIESSQKIKDSAFTKYFPKVSAGAFTFRMQDPLINVSVFPGMSIAAVEKGKTGFVSAVQPVFAGGRIVNGNKLSSISKDVSKLKYRMHQDEVLLKTEEQYWQIVSLNEKMKTILRYEELLNRLLQQVEDSYKAGISMRNDVLKVRQKRSEVELNKSKLENGIRLAIMSYCQYIGIPYDSGISFNDKVMIKTKPEELYVNSRDVIKNRAEYTLLRKFIESEELKTKLKLGEYLPQVGVGAGMFYTQFDNSKWIDDKMIFASATLPISDWWDAGYSLKERNIQEKIENNNKNDKIQLLLLQIEKAWKDVEDAYKQLSLSEISKAQADENLNLNRDSYNNGIIDIGDLLEAQAIFQGTEDQLIEAKNNYRIRQIYYLQATGRNF